MARIIAFPSSTQDAKVWINPDFVMRVDQNGAVVVVQLADGSDVLIAGEAEEVVAKLNARLDP